MPLQSGCEPAHLEHLPAVGVLRDRAGHEHFDGPSGLGRDEVGQHHPYGEADVGPIGPHPERGFPFIDHPRLGQGHLHAERRAGRGLDDEPLARRTAVGGVAGAAMADDARSDIRFGDLPRVVRRLEGVFDRGRVCRKCPANRDQGRGERAGDHVNGRRPRRAEHSAVTSIGHRRSCSGKNRCEYPRERLWQPGKEPQAGAFSRIGGVGSRPASGHPPGCPCSSAATGKN